MRINRLKSKVDNQEHRQADPYYQSQEHKYKRDLVWERDQGLCQICLDKGILHELVRGTKDITKQGTVDHRVPRKAGGSDDLSNLRLIGSIHHAKKSNQDKKYYE